MGTRITDGKAVRSAHDGSMGGNNTNPLTKTLSAGTTMTMFGFSPLKIIVLLAIIAAVWYGFKVFARGKPAKKVENDTPAEKDEGAVDMEACAVCGDYVPDGSSACGKDDCPYPPG